MRQRNPAFLNMPHRPSRRPFLIRFLAVLTILLCGFVLLGYALGYTARPAHWLTGFYLMALPVGMGVLLLLGLYWLFRQPRQSLLPILVLGLGWPFWQRTVALHETKLPPRNSLRVLSYNVYFFDVDRYYYEQKVKNAPGLIDFAVRFEADVKCFQEFYNRDDDPELTEFQTIRRLRENGYPHYASTPTKGFSNRERGFIGLAIFSKYPIVKKRTRLFETTYNRNGYVLADLAVPGDTVRVINVHLESTGIRVGRVIRGKTLERARVETRSILRSLKRGFDLRIGQIQEIEQLIRDSPHPVIVSGDFNEMPYGLAYGRIRKLLRNSFEDAGRGFGLTLNRSPRFLRIDNQFYDAARLEVTSFETHRDVEFSDHFPISGSYELK